MDVPSSSWVPIPLLVSANCEKEYGPTEGSWWGAQESLGVCEEEQVRDFLQAPETAYLGGSFLGVLGQGLSPGMLSGMCVGGGLGPCAPL